MVADLKTAGTFDYIWSLPVSRMVLRGSGCHYLYIIVYSRRDSVADSGRAYYHFSRQIIPLVIPAMLLIELAGIFLGYSLAHSIAKAQITQLITQVLVFFIMIFSPIMFPASQLPHWLATVHKYLPIVYMADLSRGTLTDLNVNLGQAFAVVGGWSAGFNGNLHPGAKTAINKCNIRNYPYFMVLSGFCEAVSL